MSVSAIVDTLSKFLVHLDFCSYGQDELHAAVEAGANI